MALAWGHWMQNFGPMPRQWWTTGITRNLASFLKPKDLYKMMSWPKHKAGPTVLWNNSLQAGFSLFTTNLENDQLAHCRCLLASSGDEAKARAAVVSSLEAHFFKGEKDCNVLRFQPYLNVCLQKIFDPDRKCIKLDGAWWIKPWLKYVPHGATHRRAVRPLETWVPCHDNNSDNRIIKFKMLSY